MSILYVIIGGSIGAAFRYLLSGAVQAFFKTPFPAGTLAVNLIGSFFIGLILTLGEYYALPFSAQLFLVAGILGGFTTFSAYTFETFALLKNGDFSIALLNVMVSNALGLVFVYLGYLLGRYFV